MIKYCCYLGNARDDRWRAVIWPKRHRFPCAWGYTLGAFRGLIQKPTAKNLTPQINWRRDAEVALSRMVVVQKGKHE